MHKIVTGHRAWWREALGEWLPHHPPQGSVELRDLGVLPPFSLGPLSFASPVWSTLTPFCFPLPHTDCLLTISMPGDGTWGTNFHISPETPLFLT